MCVNVTLSWRCPRRPKRLNSARMPAQGKPPTPTESGSVVRSGEMGVDPLNQPLWRLRRFNCG